jgi:peptidoglycan/LPS O-acetylase OafA/YrhL
VVRLVFVNTATLLGLLLVKTFHDGDRVLMESRPAAKTAVFLGQISYGVYLFHLPILMLVRSTSGLHGASALAVYVAATTGFCWLFFLLVEKPILAARPRFDAVRPSSAPSRNVTALTSPFGNRASDA